ncbi:hypothetical protein [Bacillus wiedmannii]|uniref:hypothetical protein n=1 Tax=Bacillus wiedmannii TaxID=1890302 RepID=UPI003D954F0B
MTIHVCVEVNATRIRVNALIRVERRIAVVATVAIHIHVNVVIHAVNLIDIVDVTNKNKTPSFDSVLFL